MNIERGDVYLVDLGGSNGTSMQSGVRPVIVISNNKANSNSPVIHVVPLTTRNKRNLPTHVELIITNYLTCEKTKSIALVEQVMLLEKEKLHRIIDKADDKIMARIDVAIMTQFGFYHKVQKMKNIIQGLKERLKFTGLVGVK